MEVSAIPSWTFPSTTASYRSSVSRRTNTNTNSSSSSSSSPIIVDTRYKYSINITTDIYNNNYSSLNSILYSSSNYNNNKTNNSSSINNNNIAGLPAIPRPSRLSPTKASFLLSSSSNDHNNNKKHQQPPPPPPPQQQQQRKGKRLPSMAEFEEIGLSDDTPRDAKRIMAGSPSKLITTSTIRNNSSLTPTLRTPQASHSTSNSGRPAPLSATSLSSGPQSSKSPAILHKSSSSPSRNSATSPPSTRTLVNPGLIQNYSSSSPLTTTASHSLSNNNNNNNNNNGSNNAAAHLAIPKRQSRRRRSPSPSPPQHFPKRSSSLNRGVMSQSPTEFDNRSSQDSQSQSSSTQPRLTHSNLHSSDRRPSASPHRTMTSPPVIPHSRRQSWQQGRRKTVEEMEKECDEDDDDDIPEDAVFWNVPLSPRASKSLSSASPSPERLSLSESSQFTTPTPTATPHANAFASSSSSSNSRSQSRYDNSSPTKSLSTISLPSLASNGELEGFRGRNKIRGKSWTVAMAELGDEAKILTNALEVHAEHELVEAERRLHAAVINPHAARRSSPVKKITLPPKQLDSTSVSENAVPISKEKEAALSRTRPGWLPPKNPEEEKRHLKQYQEMMRLSFEADRKKAEKLKKDAELREQTRNDLHKAWEDDVLPNWETAIQSCETREMWWSGVPATCRKEVWGRGFGNVLSVGEETFKKALERGQKLEAELKETTAETAEKKWFARIRKDAEQTMVEHRLFQSECSLHDSLVDVLIAYSMYRRDIGYVYGLNVVAANLLLNMSAPEAFITLANIMNRPLPLSFYSQDESGMTKIFALFLRAFQYKLPRLHNHIHVKLCIPPPVYLEAMFSTMFALHLPVEIVNRIWDVYSFEGDAFLIRTMVGILSILESRLYGSKEEILDILGWNVTEKMSGPEKEWYLGNEDEFMERIRAAGKEEL